MFSLFIYLNCFLSLWFFNQVAATHPQAVTACNLDLENMISDSNRSIATLAISTLLKTGAESSVDRWMKQVKSEVIDRPSFFWSLKKRFSSCSFKKKKKKIHRYSVQAIFLRKYSWPPDIGHKTFFPDGSN